MKRAVPFLAALLFAVQAARAESFYDGMVAYNSGESAAAEYI